MNMHKILTGVMLLVLCNMISIDSGYSQSLFEEEETNNKLSDYLELNGYIRAGLYSGWNSGKEMDMKSAYAELSLKTKVKAKKYGNAFAELRFKSGYESKQLIYNFDLREAYLNIYAGPFDFKFGNQITVWGRADGINPTDIISPKNPLVYSDNADDRRNAVFTLKTTINIKAVRLNILWLPFFKSSETPLDIIEYATNIKVTLPEYPDKKILNGAIASKVDFEFSAMSFSISYFNGYNPDPGINIVSILPQVNIAPKTYRLNMAGLDFSSTIGNIMGIRGEVAFKYPTGEYNNYIHIPYPEIQYVLGINKEFFNKLNIILQYVGKYVFDYKDIPSEGSPQAVIMNEILKKNRIIRGQDSKINNSIFIRIGLALLHEQLNLESAFMYNFNTVEFFAQPKISYDIADNLYIVIGANIYWGKNNTLFDLVNDYLSTIYTEFKFSY